MVIKNIIFDFGGVLIDWNPRYLYKDHFDQESDMEYFLTNICNGEWNEQQDAGRTLSEATEMLVQEYPEYEALIRLYYDKWEHMIKDSIQENVQVLHELKNKDSYRLYGLSNWSGETFPIAFDKYPFFQKFDGIVISGDEKMKKPEKEIYELILARYRLAAGESLFIDDNSDNIKMAKSMGFETIHFANGIDLRNELQKMNIL